MRQMNPMDAFMYYLDSPRTPNVITFVNLHDQSTVPGGPLTFRDVLRGMQQRLHLSRAFREKIARVPLDLDHPYWVADPDFDLEFHVRHIALPKPGDWRQLCILVARLASRQLDLSRPPWEMWIVEGLDDVQGVPPGGFAVVLRIHHSAIDGVAGADMLTAISSTSPDAPPPAPAADWRPEGAPSQLRRLRANGELPADSLVALVPVSVRDDRKPDAVGNEIASMAVPLHTDVDDAVERLRRVHRSTQQSKARKKAVGARTLTEMAAAVPGGLMGLAFKAQSGLAELARVQMGPNTSVTNVPGPTVPLYFLGARMVASWGVAPLSDGVGLFHIVSSYTGRLTLSFTADRAMMADPAFYLECMEKSFDELAAAARAHAG